ncbi:argonaute-like protein [Desarmillaria tabescens]|uniref:Argonaute-like protein n=1 Tax=Armillaria tabescens TaxID=1929756 RepID=A0AA39NLF5_ARMTA|nr:argonaute-like protein [Desarmillaria tabescens]KAK0467814.1 argonaute-like protein [Desarmillaria tabescens]
MSRPFMGGHNKGHGGRSGGGNNSGGQSRIGGTGGRGPGGFNSPVVYKENVLARIPDHLTPDKQNKLIAVLRKVPVKATRPTRPDFGTLGKHIVLRSNFFPIELPEGPLYEYEVKIEPTTFLNRRKDRIFQLLEASPQVQPWLGFIAHDRSTRLVSAVKFPTLSVAVPFYEKDQDGPSSGAITYQISIIFKVELNFDELSKYLNANEEYRDYDPLPIISALNLVLQQNAMRTGVRIGQNKYYFQPPPSEHKSLGPSIEAWRGFSISVRPAYKQLMVNIKACMAPFVKPGNLADVLELFNRDSLGGMPTLPKGLARSIKVVTTYLGHKRRYKLWDIGHKSAQNTTFPCEEFEKNDMSIEEFFKKKYKIDLIHGADLPVVNVGNAKRPVWLPAELCTIEAGNPYRGRLSNQEVAQMIRHACNPPHVNAESITGEGFSNLSLSPPQPPVDGFGISIDQEMAVIPARELPPPELSYGQGTRRVTNGSWNILGSKFHRGATIDGFWVLPIRERINNKYPPPKDIKPLIMAFLEKLQSSGMNVPAGMPRLLYPLPIRGGINSLNTIRSCLQNAMQNGPRPSFVLVLLMHRDNFIYPGVKVTMQLENAMKVERQDQYLSNIALKVNIKLGGINHKGSTLPIPTPGTRFGTPSIAAVVASVDDDFVQFPASMRIQRPDTNKHSKEVVEELQHMMLERLLAHKKKNDALPERILVFRDGVSEGQYNIVIREEVAQIMEAAKKLDTKDGETYKPLVSVIICGKRHNAQFYPTDRTNADKKGNTKPGTVVDQGITGVFDYDFYLQAHAGLQGTVKPTHYVVIYDENDLGVDDLQKGTNDTSYLYARSTRADDSSTVSGSLNRDEEAARVFDAAQEAWGHGLHDDIKDSMFYI